MIPKFYLVKLIEVTEWDEEAVDGSGWFRESEEGIPRFYICNEKEYGECLEVCIRDDPEHYTDLKLIAVLDDEDLVGVFGALLKMDKDLLRTEVPYEKT